MEDNSAPDSYAKALYEIKSFQARMIERYGVTTICILWRAPFTGPEDGGGFSYEGDSLMAYAMCKNFVLTEETRMKEMGKAKK